MTTRPSLQRLVDRRAGARLADLAESYLATRAVRPPRSYGPTRGAAARTRRRARRLCSFCLFPWCSSVMLHAPLVGGRFEKLHIFGALRAGSI
jgi:hypothetical protein